MQVIYSYVGMETFACRFILGSANSSVDIISD